MIRPWGPLRLQDFLQFTDVRHLRDRLIHLEHAIVGAFNEKPIIGLNFNFIIVCYNFEV